MPYRPGRGPQGLPGRGGLTLNAQIAELPGAQPVAASQSGREKLGLSVQPLTPGLSRQLEVKDRSGLVVAEVMAGSPAAQAGLQPGDGIVQVNRKPVRSIADLGQALAAPKSGEPMLFRVHRKEASLFGAVRHAWLHALALGQAFGASAPVLRVVEILPADCEAGARGFALPTVESSLRQAAEGQLQPMRAEAGAAGVAVVTGVVVGRVPAEILQAAGGCGATLIAMGAGGHGGVLRPRVGGAAAGPGPPETRSGPPGEPGGRRSPMPGSPPPPPMAPPASPARPPIAYRLVA